ncbi:CC0125/CC1285 family lipoprotein [Solimonas sp. K1W22B-7]|uniref:CC0125/CC1285 family lipoprotein n=1 Tax=Solimonas sp. K1W22B-7 TaxID=2303331 RepID=UPI001F09703E|nr:hypothetical protein [Solimonas sp. K1W22B-7]
MAACKTVKSVAAAALAVPLLLAGCATTTPYQPMKNGQGYGDQRIESNRYRVSFSGNSSTPRETVENYLLFRAAELTLQNGYDYFVMSGTDTEAQTRYQQNVSAFGGYGWYSRYAFDSVAVGSSYPITEYQAQAYVTLYKGKRPAEVTDAFDARQVRDNLGPLVKYAEKR